MTLRLVDITLPITVAILFIVVVYYSWLLIQSKLRERRRR